MFCRAAGCTSPVARHRLHVTGCTSRQRTRSPLAVTAGRLLVTSLHVTAGCRTRWPSPLPVARHRLHVGPVAPLAVTGCTSPAGRLLVSGPAGRHRAGRLLVARQRTRWPSPLAGCSSRLHVTGCTSRQRTRLRWPSPVARHPLAGCSSADPLAVTRRRTLHVTAGRLLVSGPVARHRLHVTAAVAVSGPAGRHVLHRLLSSRLPVARQRTRWPVARHV